MHDTTTVLARMGSFFSSTKRPLSIEAESVASANPSTGNPADHHRYSYDGPSSKRQKIESPKHNDVSLDRVNHLPVQTRTSSCSRTAGVPAVPVVSMPQGLQGVKSQTQFLSSSGLRSGDVSQQPISAPKRDRFKKRKFALFLGYLGEQYHGMQINHGVTTIEELLMKALHKANLVSAANHLQPRKLSLMRAARTDKGVSAALQCVSLKLECTSAMLSNCNSVVHSINDNLPGDVQVYGILRVTSSFNARQDCHRRRYEYIFPLGLLGGKNAIQVSADDPDAGDSRVQKFSTILRQYEGSHCFANFTEGLDSGSDSARRYIIRVSCLSPFIPPGSALYYVPVEIIGQSFLLHQIRKMIGLALTVYHGHIPEESISVALCPEVRLSTPLAPAEGLLLDTLYFDHYSAKHKKTLGHAISHEVFAEAKRTFKEQKIYFRIAQRECHSRALELWVSGCKHRVQMSANDIISLHEKYVRTDVGKLEQRKAYAASLYPIWTDIEAFINSSPRVEKHYFLAENVRKQFEVRYGTPPSFMVRAPGRVILIGEHLDYNGFPVISAAMAQGTLVAGCLDPSKHVEIQHLEDQVYNPGRMSVNGELIECDSVGGAEKQDKLWLNYVAAGFKTLIKALNNKRTVSGGGRILIAGDLPRAGGLASSSSLVSAAVLTAARLNRRRFPKEMLAASAAEGERGDIGTRGGCVDHVTSMCAEKNSVLHVSFIPKVTVTSFSWPDGARLFAVSSLTTAQKGRDATIKHLFNLRASECRIAAAILAHRLRVHLANAVTTPGQLLFNARKTGTLKCDNVSSLWKKVEAVMDPNECMNLEAIKSELGLSEMELQNRFLKGVAAISFEVGKRITHVLSEAERVEKFVDTLSSINIDEERRIQTLGRILNEGHMSLQRYYESSIKEVDEIVTFCRRHGAIGSRMTGAGWGGFTINIVLEESVAEFVTHLVGRVGASSVIEVSPWSGACLFAIHQNIDSPRLC